jgi:two-component system, LytTR family, response regulator
VSDGTLWRTIIVDDEPLARDGIRTRLEALGGFAVVDECGSARAAIASIRTHAPDLVFLDVQMPVMDGFAVVTEVGPDRMPEVVFVTAHDRYALQAFDARAIDYVLKPIDDSRFARTVDSVRRRLTDARASGVARQLVGLLAETRPAAALASGPVDRLVAKDGDRIEVVPFAEIDFVSADGDYVRVHAGNRQLLLRLTMTALEQSLPAGTHVRIHRSTIVNASRIRSLKALPNTEYAVELRNGVTLRASRSYADRLRRVLGLSGPNETPT